MGAPTSRHGNFLPKSCVKTKELVLWGRASAVTSDPPMLTVADPGFSVGGGGGAEPLGGHQPPTWVLFSKCMRK